jgi:hypothetical protein
VHGSGGLIWRACMWPRTSRKRGLICAEDVEDFGSHKARFQMLSRRNARSASKSMQSILMRGIYVNNTRAEALMALDQTIREEKSARSPHAAGAAGAARGATEGSMDAGTSWPAQPTSVAGVDTEENTCRSGSFPLLLLDFTDLQVCCVLAGLVAGTGLLPRASRTNAKHG